MTADTLFLSADRVHANVEKIVRKFFTEFFDIIKNSRKKLEVKTLTHKDIYIFQNMQKLDIIKVLKIREVKVCSFRKGCFDLNV